MKITASSGPYALDLRDVIKGLIMAVLVPVLTIIMDSINNGSLTFDWKQIGIAAIGGFVGYLIKNFFTQSQIVVTGAHPTTVEAVKDGKATIEVKPK